MNEGHYQLDPTRDLFSWARSEAIRAEEAGKKAATVRDKRAEKQALLEMTPEWIQAKELRSSVREARKLAIKKSPDAVAAQAAANEAKKVLRKVKLYVEVKSLGAEERAALAIETQVTRMVTQALAKGKVPSREEQGLELSDGTVTQLVLPGPAGETPEGPKAHEDPELREPRREVPPVVHDALDIYRSGKETRGARNGAAMVLIDHIVGGGALPEGMDRTQVLCAAREVAAATAPQPGPADTGLRFRVTQECVKTVNLIPVDNVKGAAVGMLLLAAGEVLEVVAVKPRRLELVANRGTHGTTAKTIPLGCLMSVLEEASTPPPPPRDVAHALGADDL